MQQNPNIKKCTQCQAPMSGKRTDAKFCCTSCKAAYWEAQKQEQGEAKPAISNAKASGEKPQVKPEMKNDFASGLRGIVDHTPKPKVEIVTQPNPQYQRLAVQKVLAESRLKQLQEDYNRLLQSYQFGDMPRVLPIGGVFAGLVTAHHLKKDDHWAAAMYAIAGLGAGMVLNNISENKTKKAQRDALYGKEFAKVKGLIDQQTGIIQQTQIEMSMVEPVITKEVVTAQSTPTEGQDTAPPSAEGSSSTPLGNISSEEPVANSKIISSTQLANLDLKALDFQGKWLNFMGQPAVGFHCVLHGMSGEGKSTFAIQFAYYLAENFGRVVYVSGEEGFAKTFKDKFLSHKAVSNKLDVADLRNFDELTQNILPGVYHFIFIDSLDNMDIDANQLKELRKLYEGSALVTISQSTKDGKMRGSNEIMHDSDLAVKVSNGLAVTTKNRFKEKGMQYQVFETKDSNKPKNTGSFNDGLKGII